MRGSRAGPSDMIAFECCASDCILAQGHEQLPDAIKVNLAASEIATSLEVFSHDTSTHKTLPGVLRRDGILALMNESQSITYADVLEGPVACNGLCLAVLMKEESNGREKI